jgi:hypothetical protein
MYTAGIVICLFLVEMFLTVASVGRHHQVALRVAILTSDGHVKGTVGRAVARLATGEEGLSVSVWIFEWQTEID